MSEMSKKRKMSKKLRKKMRMSNEEFSETGQVQIKLKKKVMVSYDVKKRLEEVWIEVFPHLPH